MIPKFRAWLKDEQEMHDVLAFDTRGNSFLGIEGTLVTVDGWCDCWEVGKHVELMQSTGLKDKNGVEIFEGDIVHVLDSEQINRIDENGAYVDAFFEELEEIDIIEFDDGRFKLRNTEFNVSICRTVEDFKVIGNIYENPELLERS